MRSIAFHTSEFSNFKRFAVFPDSYLIKENRFFRRNNLLNYRNNSKWNKQNYQRNERDYKVENSLKNKIYILSAG